MKCRPNTVSKIRKARRELGIVPKKAKIGRPTKKTPQHLTFPFWIHYSSNLRKSIYNIA